MTFMALRQPIEGIESMPAPVAYQPTGLIALSRDDRSQDEIDLGDIIVELRRRRLFIGSAIVIAVALTVVIDLFVRKPVYRAEALIRPVTESSMMGSFGDVMSSAGGLASLGQGLLNNEAADQANEYMPIMQSFEFINALAVRHNLGPLFLGDDKSWLGGSVSDPNWTVYHRISDRFECEFSFKSDNISLYFQDTNRDQAAIILGYFINDLREKLRREQIEDSTAAEKSIEQQVRGTSDPLLANELYQIIANQVQRGKMAEAEADFAFRVLEAPTAPDKPYRPKPSIDAAIAGFLAFVFATGWVVLRRRVPTADSVPRTDSDRSRMSRRNA
jgi:capsular polysaccharide biosynthesis protein